MVVRVKEGFTRLRPASAELRRGFTLIELLLVISIIGILAGIVIVALSPSRQLAQVRNAQRRSDVRAIAAAIDQYVLDQGGDDLPAGLDITLRVLGTAGGGCSVPCGGTQDVGSVSMDSIAALWHLDETSGTIADNSGNSRNSAVISGVTYGATGHLNTALSFDGNDYVDFPTIFPHDSDPKASIDEVTSSAWFRTSSPPSADAKIVWVGWGGTIALQMNSTGVVSVWIKQTKNGGTNYDGSWHGQNSGLATFADGSWHHIAGRYHRTENTLKLYVDGDLLGTNTGMNASEYLSDPSTNHPPIIGAASLWTGARTNYFTGDIDEVALWSRALTDLEIEGLSGQGEEMTAAACLDLSPSLVDTYLASIPFDPSDGDATRTSYAARRTAISHTYVRACSAELGEEITVER
ncbi:MAG TPA: LamG-like jellyroll fold domain-containing protein [Candidatus Peribacterales bacterium]|nr:LamG-like jellyroll fold domain-containing protein [Candidatus Peribacterales bacterium]